MKLTSIRVENFLSFEDFRWDGLDPRLNMVVGPNDVGKTNLIRALQAFRDAWDYDRRRQWEGAAHKPSSSPSFRIEATVEFTSHWEQEVIRAYLGSVFCDEDAIRKAVPNTFQVNPASLSHLSEGVYQALERDDLGWLFRGKFTVEYQGRSSWRLDYVPSDCEPGVKWCIEDHRSGHDSLWFDPDAERQDTFFATWIQAIQAGGNENFLSFLSGARNDLPLGHLSTLLRNPSKPTSIRLEAHRPQTVDFAPQTALQNLLGFTMEDMRGYNSRFLFGQLFDRLLVFTQNSRREPIRGVTPGQINSLAPVDLSTGEMLPLYLFKKKMGGEGDKKTYKQIEATFHALTDTRSFDVEIGSFPSPARGAEAPPPDTIPITVQIIRDSFEMPMENSGAGMSEALLISSMIADDGARVVCLDEPALNLHPPIQSGIISHIRRVHALRVKRKEEQVSDQLFIVTHSPFLTDTESVLTASRLLLESGNTVRASLDLANCSEATSEEIRRVLRSSADVRGMPFARAVILVEGDSEFGALRAWFAKTPLGSFDTRNVVLLDAGGDQGLATYLRLASGFKIPWAIVCDGPVIGPYEGKKSIAVQLKEAGIADLQQNHQYDSLDFSARRALLEGSGIFTVVNGPKEEFECLQILKEWDEKAGRAVGSRSKPRKDAWTAERTDPPAEIVELQKKLFRHFKLPMPVPDS